MSGTDTAAMVGTRYDVILDGVGYLYDKRPEARAELSYTPTFLDRQNTSGAYGDNEQEFFLTATQHDWSHGEGIRFFNPADEIGSSSYYYATGVAVRTAGEFGFDLAADAFTPTTNFLAACGKPKSTNHYCSSSTNRWEFDGSAFSDLGAHGAGTPNKWGMCTDRRLTYIAGSGSIRSWDGASFAAFSATANAGSLAYLNNALYSCDGTTLRTYDGAGAATTLFTWKDGTNTGYGTLSQKVKVVADGARLLILFQHDGVRPQLWMYDGDGTTVIAELPSGHVGGVGGVHVRH